MSAATTPRLEVRVAAVESPAPGVRTLRLEPPDGRALLPFAPGSHVEVECGGRRNAHSLASDGRDPSHYAISVLRSPAGGTGSAWLHDGVRPGDTLRIGPPRSAVAAPARRRAGPAREARPPCPTAARTPWAPGAT